MTKETLEQAIYLEERIQRVQEEIDSLKKFDKECSLTNFHDNVTIFLTAEEKELILPPLLERKIEELRLLQNEFERL